MRVIGDKNQISENVFEFMISFLPYPHKSTRSELAKLFSISIYVKPYSSKKWLKASPKNIDSGELVQSGKADLCRNSLLSGHFCHVKGSVYLAIWSFVNPFQNDKS